MASEPWCGNARRGSAVLTHVHHRAAQESGTLEVAVFSFQKIYGVLGRPRSMFDPPFVSEYLVVSERLVVIVLPLEHDLSGQVAASSTEPPQRSGDAGGIPLGGDGRFGSEQYLFIPFRTSFGRSSIVNSPDLSRLPIRTPQSPAHQSS